MGATAKRLQMSGNHSHMPATELLIFGLLRRSELSAYALNKAVRAHAPLYRSLKRGNIYHNVSVMAEAGFLEPRAAKSARGPSETKTTFCLSERGNARFRELLRGIVTDVHADDATLEIALVLLGQIPRDEALLLVGERMRLAVDQEKRLARIVGDLKSREGSGYLAMLRTFSRARSEIAYLRDIIKLVQNAKWSPEWVTDDGPIVDKTRAL